MAGLQPFERQQHERAGRAVAGKSSPAGGGLAQHLGRKILGSGSGGLDHLSVGFAHAHLIHVQLLGRGEIAENQLPQRLHSGLGLHPNHGNCFLRASVVIFIADKVVQLVKDG
jgi:hypothetical protein